LEHLLSLQHVDGGWGWCQGSESDAYISSYALYGLATARELGITVSGDAIDRAVGYVSSQLFSPSVSSKNWELDRLAFENYALMVAKNTDLATANRLYDVRDQLSPWAEALLALTLNGIPSQDQKIQTLLSDLQSTAIRSATGVHWEGDRDWRNMTTTLTNSAITLYTLAKLEPASTLIPDGVNYLMSNRLATGCWSSSYENFKFPVDTHITVLGVSENINHLENLT
jgi:uncharacterized protein YfaS (alpha-2-macroglobulin family)